MVGAGSPCCTPCLHRKDGGAQTGGCMQMKGRNKGGSKWGSNEGEAKGTERGEREAVSLVVFE